MGFNWKLIFILRFVVPFIFLYFVHIFFFIIVLHFISCVIASVQHNQLSSMEYSRQHIQHCRCYCLYCVGFLCASTRKKWQLSCLENPQLIRQVVKQTKTANVRINVPRNMLKCRLKFKRTAPILVFIVAEQSETSIHIFKEWNEMKWKWI